MWARPSSKAILRAVLLVIVLIALLSPGGTVAAQEQPETANEYFNTLRSMEEMEIYENYGELETIHSRSLTEVQVGEFSDNERQKLDAVIGMIRSFSNASEHAEDGNYREAFQSAEQVDSHIDDLENYDRTYSVLARLALTRFYENLGNELSSRANAVEQTPVEIEVRSMAATAYKRANAPEQAAEFIRQSERLRAQYGRDVEFMNQTATQAQTFLQDCEQCSAPVSALAVKGLDVFSLYNDARSHHRNTVDARERATTHGLSERSASFGDIETQTSAVWGSLGIASAIFVIGYGILIGLIASVLTWRVFSWKRTYLAAQVDSVVAMGDSDV